MSALEREIRRMARGEEAALAALYDATSQQVFGVCLRILGDASLAEEVALDVFLQAWSQAAAYDRARGTPEAWLLIIARSRALDRRRAERARRDGPCGPVCDRVPARAHDAAGVAVAGLERDRSVRAALARLNPTERVALEYAFWNGMSHAQIARQLGEPLGTVKSRIRSALAKLRNALSPLAAGGNP